MINKNELKYYSSLLQKKFRNEENKFIIEGEKNVLEGLNSSSKPEIIFVTYEFSESNPDLAGYLQGRARTEILKSHEFNKLTDTITPQGIAAVFHKTNRSLNPDKSGNEVIVVLDNISDPGNAGTIIRTCDWFGIKEVILSSGSAEIYNPKTLRSSMGSVFHLNIYENVDLSRALSSAASAGYKIYCTDINGESIYKTNFPDKVIIIFSNEANGPSENVRRMKDVQITIPGSGKAESLNVAAAAGIVLAELFRQKHPIK